MINEFQDAIQSADPNDVRVFLLLRKVREGIPVSRRDVMKYIYHPRSVAVDPELQAHLKQRYLVQIGRVKEEVLPYEILSEEGRGPFAFTYDGVGSTFLSLLKTGIEDQALESPVTDLRALGDQLWATVIAFSSPTSQTATYVLNKAADSRIAGDIREIEGYSLRGKLMTVFDSRQRRLRLLDSTILSLPNEAAAFGIGARYLVLNKPQFEQIVGMEEKFLQTASNAIELLHRTNLVVGLDRAASRVQASSRFMRRVAHLFASPDLLELTPDRIARMRTTAMEFGKHLTVNADGQVVLENENDVDLFIKLVEDYFLQSSQTGMGYGARVKTRLQRQG